MIIAANQDGAAQLVSSVAEQAAQLANQPTNEITSALGVDVVSATEPVTTTDVTVPIIIAPPSPPPAPAPPADLESLTALPRESAQLSSTFGAYNAGLAINGDLADYCVSTQGVGNWLSISVPTSTPIGYVAAYNIQGSRGFWPEQLGEFGVWVGNRPGDTASSSAVKCGDASYRGGGGLDTEPYVLWCGGAVGEYVTLKQSGGGRYLVISEMYAYSSTRLLPPSSSPSPPPSASPAARPPPSES